MDESYRIYNAALAGRIRHASRLWPVVGDYVTGEIQPGHWVQIQAVDLRKTWLSRRDSNGDEQILAANIDTLFIVTSANQDLNINRLERYVVLAETGGIRPVIIINKIELSSDPGSLLDQVAARISGVDVLGTSATEAWNVDALIDYANAGQTVAFVGSSGVGKSSLTNALLGNEIAVTSAIRADDDRGRHTTTHRELHLTPWKAFVIDTPGLRTVGLTADAEHHSAFTDIEDLMTRCRFSNCAHETEPDCAIQAALATGLLQAERWANFLKLGRELAYERRKSNKALQAVEKNVGPRSAWLIANGCGKPLAWDFGLF